MTFVFVTLLVVPNRFANQVVMTMATVLGETAVLLADVRANPPGAITALVSLLLATVVAMAAALRLHSSRRREFLAHERERQARTEVERRMVELGAAEEALSRERALLKTVVQQMPAGLVVMEALGNVALSNDKTRETMGAAADPADLDTRARAIAFRRLNGESYRTQELPGAVRCIGAR